LFHLFVVIVIVKYTKSPYGTSEGDIRVKNFLVVVVVEYTKSPYGTNKRKLIRSISKQRYNVHNELV